MPNPFQQLISQMLGQASRGFVHDDPDATLAVRVIGRVQEHLFGRWAAAQSTRLPCAVRFHNFHTGQVSVCIQPMIGVCVCCQQPCCLEHAHVSVATGEAICMGCIELAKSRRQGAPAAAPSADDDTLRRKYMRMLKLKGDPDVDAIRAAYKRAAAAAHPDRHPDDKKKAAEKRFIELGVARDWLIARYEAEEAAA